jgi:hypothetical protein
MSDEALLIGQTEDAPSPADAYAAELGIRAPRTDAEKREADVIAAMPHVDRASNETRENLAQLREENTDAVAGQRWARQDELGEAHQDERTGRIITAHQFLKMLWQCGIVCVLTRMNVAGLHSLKGESHARERRAHYDRTMAGLVVNSSRAMPLPAPRYVTWIQIPAMIEFSVMRFDAHGLPLAEKYRGWRTVLLELIRQGLLTERDVNRVFGEATGPGARRWLEILQSIRTNAGIC